MAEVLGLVPARAGSRGVPGKNLKLLGGKPLLLWTLDAAAASGACGRVVLTTEDEEIARVGRSAGADVPFLRPRELASDATPMIDVVVHALEELRDQHYVPDVVVLLQPTSPFRRPEHVAEAVRVLLSDDEADAVCSVVALPPELCPHYVMRIDEHGRLVHFLPDGRRYTRRQDVPLAYRRDGSVYVTRTSVLLDDRSFYGERCIPLVIDDADSVTIDEPADWTRAEQRAAAWAGPGDGAEVQF